jgi:hypothetical protein
VKKDSQINRCKGKRKKRDKRKKELRENLAKREMIER